MASCPVCQKPIEIAPQNYGDYFKCPSCEAQYFIGFDGNPQSAQASPEVKFETYDEDAAQSAVGSAEIPGGGMGSDVPVFEMPASVEESPPVEFKIPGEMQPDDKANVFSDVVDYGNSTVTSGLSYDVIIRGIDHQSLHQQLRDVLSDSKFNWSVDEKLRSIQSGELRIEKMSPVKAAILVQRLRFLPLEVTWIQNVLS